MRTCCSLLIGLVAVLAFAAVSGGAGSFAQNGKAEDAPAFRELRRFRAFEESDKHRTNAAVLTADGKSVLTADSDCVARLWNAETGELVRRFEGHTNPIIAIAVSPGGKYLLTRSMYRVGEGKDSQQDLRSTRLWNVGTGKEIDKLELELTLWPMAYSPDGRHLLAVSGETPPSVHLWDLETPKEVRVWEGTTFGHPIFAPDGKRVLAEVYVDEEFQSQRLRLFDVSSGESVIDFGDGKTKFTTTAFSPDGKRLAAACMEDTKIRVWDVESGKELRSFTPKEQAFYLAFSPDSKLLLTAGWNAELWDIEAGISRAIHLNDPKDPMKREPAVAAAFSPDGKRLLLARSGGGASQNKGLAVWFDVETGREVRCEMPGLSGAELSSDGKHLLTVHGYAEKYTPVGLWAVPEFGR